MDDDDLLRVHFRISRSLQDRWWKAKNSNMPKESWEKEKKEIERLLNENEAIIKKIKSMQT